MEPGWRGRGLCAEPEGKPVLWGKKTQRLRALAAGRRGLCSRPRGDKEGGQKHPALVPALGLLVFVTLDKYLPTAGPGSPGVGLGELR